eukprot:1394509-Rhodomonas_salina.1
MRIGRRATERERGGADLANVGGWAARGCLESSRICQCSYYRSRRRTVGPPGPAAATGNDKSRLGPADSAAAAATPQLGGLGPNLNHWPGIMMLMRPVMMMMKARAAGPAAQPGTGSSESESLALADSLAAS